MKKLLKKQGFTLVELIVVIAIMAILLAMLIPSLSTQQSFEQEVRENARAFYSNVQGLMVDEKLRGTVLNSVTETKNSDYTFIYAEVTLPNTSTAQTDVSVIFINKDTDILGGKLNLTADPTEISDTDKLHEFEQSLNKLLRTSNNEGYYYAVVDKEYRVVYTYYSRYVDFDSLKTASHVADYKVRDDSGTENYLGAYPYSMNFSDVLFPDPNVIAPHA